MNPGSGWGWGCDCDYDCDCNCNCNSSNSRTGIAAVRGERCGFWWVPTLSSRVRRVASLLLRSPRWLQKFASVSQRQGAMWR